MWFIPDKGSNVENRIFPISMVNTPSIQSLKSKRPEPDGGEIGKILFSTFDPFIFPHLGEGRGQDVKSYALQGQQVTPKGGLPCKSV